jgi:hypothetical protein
MTAAVPTAHLTGQMVMAGSPVRGTGRRAIAICEAYRTSRNASPYGAPQLGQRRLYGAIGATMNRQAVEMGLLVDVEANPEATGHISGEAS